MSDELLRVISFVMIFLSLLCQTFVLGRESGRKEKKELAACDFGIPKFYAPPNDKLSIDDLETKQ